MMAIQLTALPQRKGQAKDDEALLRLRRKRRTIETRMRSAFDPALSLQLDALLAQEDALSATAEEDRP